VEEDRLLELDVLVHLRHLPHRAVTIHLLIASILAGYMG
jgi:hypothetical protein